MASTSTSNPPPAITIPPNHTLHTESSTHILLGPQDAFLNPAQQFNRDLSVAVIRTWSEMVDEEKRERWAGKRKRREEAGKDKGRKKRKVDGDEDVASASVAEEPSDSADQPESAGAAGETEEAGANSAEKPDGQIYRPYKFTMLEAFAATGLRSIRYAKELPLLKYVVANDLSAAACEAVRRNAEINGLEVGTSGLKLGAGGKDKADQSKTEESKPEDAHPGPSTENSVSAAEKKPHPLIRVQQGDARLALYTHTSLPSRYDAIDLDPYGTASPFLDGAVQSLSDGGLLLITCTDMSVLASTNYAEKCYANYGGLPVKAEYSHEAALRLVLHAVASSAARYGRTVEPLLSLSMDFYVRLFVRIRTSPLEVKQAASKTGVVYVCSGCQSWRVQPLGRYVPEAKGNPWKLAQAPPPHTGEACPECGSKWHLAGPMWIAPLHSPSFVQRVLAHVNSPSAEEHYGTHQRMRGMLTVASQELPHQPFYFTPSQLAGMFHCVCPSLQDVVSALLNAGHECSRSHASAGSVKTSASREEVYDIFRSWIKGGHAVNMAKVKEGSPGMQLLSKEIKREADFTLHPEYHAKFTGIKLVRYTAEKWAPGTRAKA